MSPIQTGWLALALGIAAFAAWGAVAPLHGAVVAEGVVKAEGERKSVSHQEGGIVKTIHVKDGDHVQAGQVLVTLSDVRVGAGLDGLQLQHHAEAARAARLSAERDMAASVAYPAQLRNSSNPRLLEIMRRETSLFAARRQALDTQLALLRQQAQDVQREFTSLDKLIPAGLGAMPHWVIVQREFTSLDKLIATTNQAAQFAAKELASNEKLLAEGYISELRVTELRRAAADYRAKHEQQQQEHARAQQKATDLALQQTRLQNDYAKQANDELKDATERLYKLEEDLRPLQDAQTRQQITAPLAGEVVDLKVHTTGAPLGPREPVLDIAPHGTPMLVEARIKPENIRDIAPGSAADVRLTAYRQRSTPVIAGSVRYLGADRLTDKATNQPYYLAHIAIAPEALAQASAMAGQTLTLQTGMQAEVFIKTEARSALDYLLEPITNGLRRSMRER